MSWKKYIKKPNGEVKVIIRRPKDEDEKEEPKKRKPFPMRKRYS